MAYFIFNKRKLQQNINKLKNAFEGINFEIYYSVKTNFCENVLEIIDSNCEFEIVSSDEWEIIKKFKHTKVVLNGPSKSLDLISNMLSDGVEYIYFNIDNDTDLDILNNLNKNKGKSIKVGIRVYLNKDGIWNRFGFDIDSERLIDIITTNKDVLRGFHFHFSTNNFDLKNYELILGKINNLIKKHSLNIEYIDIGGGLPGANEELFYTQMYQKLPNLIRSVIDKDVLIISEVGRNLVQDVFDLETVIVSTKKISSNSYDVVIDSNIMHIPCYWEKKFGIDYIPQHEGKIKKPFEINIFGNSCMQIDKLANTYLIDHEPLVEDTIRLTKVGAYSLSQASNFITRIPLIKKG